MNQNIPDYSHGKDLILHFWGYQCNQAVLDVVAPMYEPQGPPYNETTIKSSWCLLEEHKAYLMQKFSGMVLGRNETSSGMTPIDNSSSMTPINSASTNATA